MNKIIWLLLVILAGCAKKPINITASTIPFPAANLTNKHNEPLQIKVIDEHQVKITNNTREVLEQALRTARQQPREAQFLNAITIYDFIPGSVYQIYTAPQRISMISFAPGEVMVAAPQSGDTVRWQINNITSGVGENARQHLIIKPLRDDLCNNMVIATNKRVYLLELISLKRSYMLEVSWNYAQDHMIVNPSDSNNTEEKTAKKLNFNYKLINKRGKPSWRPTKVFDDGQKTFIQFPASINQNELPTLFIVSRETNTQLVNYRQHGDSLIVDRLFRLAELRLGLSNPEIIQIKRTK